ncbi:Uncharacterised protein [Lysinibacillus capsici]|uniref:Restriction endonuclease n=1 Tax=Lysinibacillus capsici TaxID=2115968 RepID=A0A2X1C1J9_9BACI|nr:hypothetical protein [Lysinibacillus capsici]SPU40716.1 Uncharacterised protein [Lysinibacillus capsici]
MERDFSWLWENLKEGARQKFEDICYDLYSYEFPEAEVHKVKVTQGDGGIDVYIDDSNGEYTIIQCKYFLPRLDKDNKKKILDASRKRQITESFNTAYKKNPSMDKWFLCIPTDLSHDEHTWWKDWKKKHNDKSITIKLHDESKLMQLVKKHDLYDEIFNTVRLDKEFASELVSNDEKKQIHDRIYRLIGSLEGVDYWIPNVIAQVDSLSDLRAHRFFRNSKLLYHLDQLSSLYVDYADGNIIKNNAASEKESQLREKIVKEYYKLKF